MNFVSRGAAGLRPPRSSTWLGGPIIGSTLHYEGPKQGIFPHSSCAAKVRAIQNYHMNNRGWSDIAYSAIVCPHGYTYEGRWLRVRSAANGTNVGNSTTYAICALIGVGDALTPELKRGLRATVEFFRRNGAGNEVRVHRQWKPTLCPGEPIVQWRDAGMPTDGNSAPTPSPTPGPAPRPQPNKFKEQVMANPVLRRGSKGHSVKIMQSLLCVHAGDLCGNFNQFIDGDFGPSTERVLRTWQARTKRLASDGICGPSTWGWLAVTK